MADNDQNNEEYQFSDLDDIVPESTDEVSGLGAEQETVIAQEPQSAINRNDVIRKSLMVIGAIIVLLILYKSISAIFSGKKETVANSPQMGQISAPPQPIPQKQMMQQMPAPTQLQPEIAPNPPVVSSDLQKKLTAMEVSQQSIQTDMTNVSTQLSTMSNNVNVLMSKITDLNTVIANLNTKLEEQSQEIERLTIHRKAAQATHHHARSVEGVKYYIQAIIPGRAWLISKNGISTLTVREGSVIKGYGVVRMIDPNQGKVMTSSGQIIRFSQEDS